VTVTTDPVPLCDWNEKPQPGGEPRWWLDSSRAPLASPPASRRRRRAHAPPLPRRDGAFRHPARRGGNRRVRRRPRAQRARFAGQTARAPPGPHALLRLADVRPDEVPRPPRRPRRRETPALRRQSRTLHAGRKHPPRCHPPPGRRAHRERSEHPVLLPDPAKPAPGRPHELKLPDGYGTWAAAWVRGGTVLWLQEKSGVRSYDFSNPAKVKEEAANPTKCRRKSAKHCVGRSTVPAPKPAAKGGASVPSPPASVRP